MRSKDATTREITQDFTVVWKALFETISDLKRVKFALKLKEFFLLQSALNCELLKLRCIEALWVDNVLRLICVPSLAGLQSTLARSMTR